MAHLYCIVKACRNCLFSEKDFKRGVSTLKKIIRNNNHKNRIKEIGRFAIPPIGTPERAILDELYKTKGSDIEIKNHVKRLFDEAQKCIITQVENGAGFPIDKLLRYFLSEFNSRNMNHGLYSMPTSFNVMEAFYKFIPEYNIFKIFKEKDSLLSFIEFLDYVTEPEFNEPFIDIIQYTEEERIYSYNITNNLDDFVFSSENGTEFVLGGASIIRHGNEITVLLLAGEKNDLLQLAEDLTDIEVEDIVPGKEWIVPSKNRKREPIALFNDERYLQVLAITRIDIETLTTDSRYLLKDYGDSYEILTDDVSSFLNYKGEFIKPEYEVEIKKFSQRIEEFSALFEMCKSIMYLPSYFENYSELIVEERHKTKFGQRSKKERLELKNKLLGLEERVQYRNVTVLNREIERQPDTTKYHAPDIKIQTTGYWKKLSNGKIGTDKQGREIHGRTWVEKTITWFETDSTRNVTIRRNFGEKEKIEGGKQGLIYVMRSAAHAKNIFKIGLTTRTSEERSEELTRTTASPDDFLVVQDWEVVDCEKAEKLIHEYLAPYRVNPKREFFKAPYKEIVRIIDKVIVSLES